MNSDSFHRDYIGDIHPWGVRPTPLIPAPLRAAIGSKEAPNAICSLAGKPLTVRDLGVEFWDHANTVDQGSLQSLIAFVRSQIQCVKHVPLDLVAGSQPLAIDTLPLSARTRNALRQHLGERQLPTQVAVSELLLIPNFGVRCLVELTCVLEAVQSCEPSQQTTAPSPQRPQSSLPPDVSRFFQLLGAWGVGEQQLDRLGSALPEVRTDWPEEIQILWKRVGDADARMLAGDIIHRYSVPALLWRWINGLDERLADILETRVLAIDKPDTLEQLGERHRVTRERIRQIEKKAIKRLEQIRSDEYLPVLRRASKLREELGTAVPENDQRLVEALNWVVADFGSDDSRSFAQKIFLWLAGPYRNRNRWLTASRGIANESKTALLGYETDRATISADDTRAALNKLGIRETHHRAWVDRLKEFKQVDEGLVCLTGNILDKAERLLRYVDRPMTAGELVDLIGSSSVRSVRQRLMDDQRFWRINKQNQFVLAGTEGYDEYTGITDELIQELEACGGSATVEHLVEKITKTYGVKPASVLAYLYTPLFVRNESNVVRVRENEEVTIATNISKTAGCYRVKDKWAWRAKVDSQLMRGSGRLFPNAFARELGCDLGDKIRVGSAFGNITISWPAGSTTGAAIGSIRPALKGLNAAVGDYVFIIAHDRQIEFLLLRKEQLEMESPIAKLACLVGVLGPKDSEDLLSRVAVALEVAHQGSGSLEQQIRDVLLSRGEDALCQLIKLPKLSMDQYLVRIGSVLGGGNSSGWD